MIAEELINQTIPPLKPSDLLGKAKQWMEELRVKELPVVSQGEYLGLLSEDMIYQHNRSESPVGEVELICNDVFVHYYQHYYEVLRLANMHAIQVIAVIGEENNFMGVVTVSDTLSAFAGSTSVQDAGGILVLSVEQRDYSLAEISRLVESNNAKILSTHISNDTQDFNKLRVTLKINKRDLSRVVATFERFGYKVSAQFQDIEQAVVDKERIDLLLKFLDI